MTGGVAPTGGGHTELTEDDRLGLLPTYISTRADLLDAEQRNILSALLRSPPSPAQLLDDKYLRDLHRAMFGDVWEWAGRYRQTETNIGVDPARIATEVVNLVRDTRARTESDRGPDEVAVQFHHRLVAIHPFPNGNGRHGRIAADYLATGLGQRAFSWGRNRYASTPDLRAAYLSALKRADHDDLEDLIAFARS